MVQPGELGGAHALADRESVDGLVRLDLALQPERNGESTVWPGWRRHTWPCWAGPVEAQSSTAVNAVRGAVLEA